uniref:Uncharacterized protein n=1 Tax=Aegilops tauschii subsp. strangulata TaxID=200361 RepID=A0A452Z682_AEGTS
ARHGTRQDLASERPARSPAENSRPSSDPGRGPSLPPPPEIKPPSPYPRHGHARLPACLLPPQSLSSSPRRGKKKKKPDWSPLSPNGRLVDPAPISSTSAGGWVAGGIGSLAPLLPSIQPIDPSRIQSNPIQ